MISSRHILIVEDEKDSCDLLEFMIHQIDERYATSSVKTGEEALDLIKKRPFDLYILDYKLPGMTGVEFCRLIRETDTNTPVIFFTGMSHWMDKRAAIKAGATEYFIKTKDWDNLKATIKQLF